MRARLVLAMACVLALTGCSAPFQGQPRTLTVELSDAAGLFDGNDVGVLGVRVGQVTAVRPEGDHVRVSLRIDDPHVRLPADVGAAVVSRSVATDRYVELTPVYSGGPQLRDGSVVPLARTATPVEFDALLRSVEEVSSGLGARGGPEDGADEGEQGPLGSLLAATARVLDGQGGTLRDGLADLATLLETVNSHRGDVEGTLGHLDDLTATLAKNDDLVRRFTSQVSAATTMLDGQKEAIGATFDALAAVVQQVASFVRAHQGQVGSQLEDFASLAQAMTRHEEQLEGLLDHGPLMLQNVIRAVDDQDRLNLRLRPISLVPGQAAALQLCAALRLPSCDGIADLPIWKLIAQLAGEATP